jgi:hypothetical protein
MERASSFAMACSLLSRYVRENGAAAGELGLGIRGEPCVSESLLLRRRKLESLAAEPAFYFSRGV